MKRRSSQPEPNAITDTETYQALLALAERRSGGVPPDRLVRHVLSVTPGADWPVRRDALDAVLRRCASARTDDIRIVRRPRGRLLGLYATQRRGASARPYRTLLRRIEPIDGSCECADFLRNSLGLCKHLVAVLEHVGSTRRRANLGREAAPGPAPLRWDPVRPLTGPGDWLARVRWVDGTPGRNLRRWLRPGRGTGWTVAAPGATRQRLVPVDRLLAALPGRKAEPALQALLQNEHARLARQIQAARLRTRLRRALRTLRQSRYRHQHDGVERFLERGRLLLADDMGLGKTAQAIAACHALWHVGRVRRGLLVVPAALKPQWLREWRLFTDVPAAVVDGSPGQRRAAFEACRRGFLLANYEQLIRDLDIVREWAPDIVVLDEAQRIKNWATKTALTVKRLDPPYRLVLTGTPMENRLDELASIVEWVDDLALEPKWRLTGWHTVPADGKTEVSGARNLETLRTRLAGCLVRRVRREVLSQLPPRTDTRIPIEMTAEQMDEHDALNLSIAQILGRTKRRSLTQAEFLRLMALLTTQRIIANGLAQLRFEQVWPDLSRIERPTDSTLRGLASPKLVELRELIIELPWNPAVLEQRIGRIHRIGQRRPIDVYHLVSESGIESRIADLVGSKKALFTGLFDGTSDQVVFERSGSFLSRLERIVAPTLASTPTRAEDVGGPEDDDAEREIEAVVAAGDESGDAAIAAASSVGPADSADTARRLVAGVNARRTAAGGLVLEASPEAASTLAALFAEMARLLQTAAARPPTGSGSRGRH